MPSETPAQEIQRLEVEIHGYSVTFANTDSTDAVTRAHLQAQMDQRTRRIQELQGYRPLGFVTRWSLRAAAVVAGWNAVGLSAWWMQAGLVLLAVFLAFYSLA
ncbi:hypothetical protein QMK19_23165 [Streptomyces sp. H10-C2]|uniref:hypothetical protein n=1 Tax=unclassified Streptomyces TaxID=2593676 RepID=UPI0024BA3497|nr:MULTISPECIES: hypothetical protein [unclassified Streptomyces]MDJ0342807.1 hypothetical protein [Streptomyces sp. PH10-H1]MDJ0372485.1 hypothetical protein [Streptomyces sp. H10-C2]